MLRLGIAMMGLLLFLLRSHSLIKITPVHDSASSPLRKYSILERFPLEIVGASNFDALPSFNCVGVSSFVLSPFD